MINHLENRIGGLTLQHPAEPAGKGLRILSDTIANNNGTYRILWPGETYRDENGKTQIHELTDGYTSQRNDPAEDSSVAG